MTLMMLMNLAMADPSAVSFPVISMLMRNPAMMQSPKGAFMISSLLGVDHVPNVRTCYPDDS